MEYDFKSIEKKWQKIWSETSYSKAIDNDDKKPKHYHLVEFPYPSGSGLHVGHCMGYGASDAYSRMKRMQGFNVLYPMGWDAFGLPTLNYAIKTGTHPKEVTKKNIKVFRRQLKSLGYSFDFDREVNTTDPNYYKWTQWIFLQFYKHALVNGKLVEVTDEDKRTPRLAYQHEMPINWCKSCKTGLANEEVVSGKCERCGDEVIKKMQKQWMLRITAYADRLIDDLDTVDYLDKIKTQQINWIGRSNGANITFSLKDSDETLEVFTTRPDTLYGATFMVVAPEHSIIKNLGLRIKNQEEVERYIKKAAKKSDLERTDFAKEKTGVELKGIKVINPINNKEIPIYVADYVSSTYGTGAIMAVPAHDERDYEFAKKYKLEIIEVIKGGNVKNEAFTDIDGGELVNSDQFNGQTAKDAIGSIALKLSELGRGSKTKNYKLRDWIFSRQHYWGEPIPIIHCEKCGTVPLDESDLPLELPDVEKYEPTDDGHSPLANVSDWVNVKCPKCGGSAKRETDTMPNWAGSSWYYLAYAMNQESRIMNHEKENVFDNCSNELEYWTPVDIYNGGMEHTTLHLLYSRFWHKFLYDMKKVPTPEPYQKRIAHGIILGTDNKKMSKSYGNVVNPDDIVKEYGADTLRAYIMFIGPYDQESAWNMDGVSGVNRFIKKVWGNFAKSGSSKNVDLSNTLNKLVKSVTEDIERFNLNTYIAKLMEFNNLLSKENSLDTELLKTYAILLSPAVPHIAEELWGNLGETNSIFDSSWPKFDESKIADENVTVVIQINGKVRDRLEVLKDTDEDELKKSILDREKIKTWTKNKEILKIVIVPNRVVNIVIK